jgi:hypothetical protein
MAQLTNSILGNISGKLGDVVFKKVNGKTIICSRPLFFNPDTSPNAIARRNKFALNALFARAANNIPVLKTLWQYFLSAYPYFAKNPFTALSKHNYHKLNNTEISDQNSLGPNIGFEFKITKADLFPDNLTIITAPLNPSFMQNANLFVNKYLKNKDPLTQQTNLHIATLVHAHVPFTKTAKPFLFIPLTTSVKNANLLSKQTFKIPIPNTTSQSLSQYSSFSLITALIITTSESDTPITNSITLHTPLS